jgi:hypothetical protein
MPGSSQRRLRLALHDPLDASLADLRLGGNRFRGHAASRHLTELSRYDLRYEVGFGTSSTVK